MNRRRHGTQRARIVLGVACAPTCTSGTVGALFDDVFLEPQEATAVMISSFTAQRRGRGVALTWRAPHEVGVAGSNVHRQQRGKLVKLNRTLIPSVFGGTTTGHAYSWLDRIAPRNGKLRYRLQAVKLDGTRSWVGSTSVRR